MWVRIMSKNSFDPDSQLQDVLPLNLWRLLARHDITTVGQVEQLYPKKLWKMHYVGPVRFREIEQHLFSGKRYDPSAETGSDVVFSGDAALEGLVSPRVYRLLKRNRILTIAQLRAAYPVRLSEISGFGLNALNEVEIAFLGYPGFKSRPPKAQCVSADANLIG